MIDNRNRVNRLLSDNKISQFCCLSLKTPVVFFVFILFTLLIYSNTLGNDFVWDDIDLIVNNEYIRVLDLKTFLSYFVNDKVSKAPGEIYRPLYVFSYALNYRFLGLEPFGYHLTNVILHAINTILVFLVTSVILNSTGTVPILRLANPPIPPLPKGGIKGGFVNRDSPLAIHDSRNTIHDLPAFIAALLFATHPIHTESVAWVKGRDDLMAFFFMLIAFYLYIKPDVRSQMPDARCQIPDIRSQEKEGVSPVSCLLSTVYYFLSLFFYLCALLSKEMAITLPLILLLYDFTIGNRSVIRNKKQEVRKILPLASYLLPFKRHLPYWLITFLYLGIRTYILGQIGQGGGYLTDSLTSKIYTISRGLFYYIRLLILPINLSVDYMTFPISRFIDGQVILSLSALLVILIGSIILYRYSRVVTFSILWFFITIFPVSNILIPVKITIAERFLYIPSFGFCLLMGVLLKEVWKRFSKPLTTAILIIVVFLYSYGIIERNRVWKNGLTLWSDTVRKYPDNPRAHSNLGVAYRNRGLLDEAINEHKIALKLSPDYAPLHYNIAIAYHTKGLLEKAIDEYKTTIRLAPNYSMAHFRLGSVYRFIGDLNRAYQEYELALRIDPSNMEARRILREMEDSEKK